MKQRITLTLEREVIRQIRALAKENERSISQYINRALKKHVKTKDNDGERIEE